MTVTWEPVLTPEDHAVTSEDEAEYERAYDLLQKTPTKAIPILKKLVPKYPNVPRIFNNLAAAYLLSGDEIKARELSDQVNTQFPNYLFGKIAKAGECLSRGETHLVPPIFDYKYDLTMIYPERDVFHGSEVVGFAGVMGRYFLEIGKLDTAKVYLEMLKGIAPDDQNTRSLEEMISITELRIIFEKIVNEGSRRRKNRTSQPKSANGIG